MKWVRMGSRGLDEDWMYYPMVMLSSEWSLSNMFSAMREEVIREQGDDGTLKLLFALVGESKAGESCYFFQDGLLCCK